MSRRRPAPIVLGALAGLAAASPPATVNRAIAVAAQGKAVLSLDADVHDRARSDLGDLRVVDDRGGQVPYLLLRMDEGPPPPRREPATLNVGFVSGHSATATLDFGGPTPKTGLVLSLAGDNFRRRVVVEGRNRHGDAWTTLVEGAYVFAVPTRPPARYETVALPENDFERLRVTVFRGADDPPRLEIRKAWIVPALPSRPQETALTRVRVARAEDARARETVLTIDLGARSQPFRAVLLDVADARFFREVAVEAQRDASASRARDRAHVWWASMASAAIYRYEEAGQVNEKLRVDACGREQAIRLRIRHGDDRPLDIRGITVLAPVERLVFEARPDRRYALEYGVPERSAPSYDVARTAGDPQLWAEGAAPATLGEPAPAGEGAGRPPWTERHPALLWAGLLAAVAALGALTWRALQAAG